MQASMFNVRVPLPDRHEMFLMNTLTDAQLIVSTDIVDLLDRVSTLRPADTAELSEREREALNALAENGFVAESRDADRRALEEYFRNVREDTSEMSFTILTTLQCNFACPYCFQGDHGHYTVENKMSLETADKLIAWAESRLDEFKPESVSITFFGGEPLLNVPVMYHLAEGLWRASTERGIPFNIRIITNGLLLTPEIVDRLKPYGLERIKVTLDGDRDTHNRMRPLRGGQGTFDRIVENISRVADRVKIKIGGNFDEGSVDGFPALLEFLREQEFADKLTEVNFKPTIAGRGRPEAAAKNVIPLLPVESNGKPLGGKCMTAAGAGSGTGSMCEDCHFAAEKRTFLRQQTKKYGFNTPDGVHMGPCHLHLRHAYAIGPDGSLYGCPGYAGEEKLAIGHVDGRHDPVRDEMGNRFETLAPWRSCGDCSFIPVCAGGCSTASYNEVGDMAKPLCHKESMELGLVDLAHESAAVA